MPDLTSQLMPRLKRKYALGLDFGEDFILPKYEDQSILNIPSTICGWMGVPELSAGPLLPEISAAMGQGIRRVILILIDALAYHRFQQWLEIAPIWNEMTQEGILAPLTSVVPSTTSSALTSLWTGASPVSHGIIGYEMWLKEYSLVANMILHAPVTFRGSVDSLALAGFSPQTFLPVQTLGSHLLRHGVRSFSFTHKSIANSGLSKMLMQDVEVRPFATPASMWVSIRQLLEKRLDERMYIWTYWGQVDGISHSYGPDDDRAAAEFSHYSTAFENNFLENLSSRARQDTVVVLTADHGQTHTPLRPNLVLSNHPELAADLRIRPTCENRFASLYLRPGREGAVRDYFDRHWPGQFILIPSRAALDTGLLGPGPHHPDILDRVGDLIAIGRGDAYLWWSDQEDFLLGRHGGLSAHEMLVPLVAQRLK